MDLWSSLCHFCCRKALTHLEGSNFSHCFVSCFWYCQFLAVFSLFCFPLCTQQEEPLAKSSRVRRRREKPKVQMTFAFCRQNCNRHSQHSPKPLTTSALSRRNRKETGSYKKTIFQNARDLRIVCSLTCAASSSGTGPRSCWPVAQKGDTQAASLK